MLIRTGDTQEASRPLASLHGLDWLNFFLAALLTGFGPFVAVYLADRGWTPASIGFVLTASGLAGLISQVPAGEIIDLVTSRRTLIGVAATAVALALLIFALRPDFPSVLTASLLQGVLEACSVRRWPLSVSDLSGMTGSPNDSAATSASPP